MIFEAIMLLCFGAAWPFSIYKTYRSASNQGKSLRFMVIVGIGYLSGIIYKAFYHFDPVIYLYVLNTIFVLTDIVLYFHNKSVHSAKTA